MQRSGMDYAGQGVLRLHLRVRLAKARLARQFLKGKSAEWRKCKPLFLEHDFANGNARV